MNKYLCAVTISVVFLHHVVNTLKLVASQLQNKFENSG